MAVEIERKFLVVGEAWRTHASEGRRILQGYLCNGAAQVRVRLISDEAFLTVKGSREGISRSEFEYAIPAEDARAMLALCAHPPIDKTRYEVQHEGHVWEIDVYAGRHAGLVVAEIELDAVGEAFAAPDWIGHEVSADSRYSNAALAEHAAPHD
ncbi:MAG: CYTH domain-containing protein [Caulobacteraceae bacterium]|nr:CYTH domain-containing protein [Caulobacteraceae bacterium]